MGEALRRAGVEPAEVSEVVMGQVLTAGQGQNPARQAAIRAGVPDTAPGYTINHVCGTGVKTVEHAAQTIHTGASAIVVARRQASTSTVPHPPNLPGTHKRTDALHGEKEGR